MPAATTHIEFAKDVLDQLPKSQKNYLSNLKMFFLGSQGPDLFFFSSFSIPNLSLQPYGAYMHRNKIEETILALRLYALGNPDLESYVAGYICHYILDSSMHESICNSAFEYAKQHALPEGETHVTIEACIDDYLLQMKNKKIQDYSVHNDIAINDRDVQLLSHMYHSVFENIYNWNISENKIKKSVKDMIVSTKFLRPNSKLKYQTVFKIESFLHVPHAVSGMMLCNKDLHKYSYNPNNNWNIDKEYVDINTFKIKYQDAISLAVDTIVNPHKLLYKKDFLGQEI